MKLIIGLLAISWFPALGQEINNYYRTDEGIIKFKSEAQLEIISASSSKLKGVMDPDKRNFAFAVPVSSFEGFNATLQQDHFNENYLESEKFPLATFTGKIIEEVDFSKMGTIEVRAKGMLKIHGVEQERIIKATLTIKEGSIVVNSKFSVSVKDHDIKIPKVVHEKIASEILIEVQAELKK